LDARLDNVPTFDLLEKEDIDINFYIIDEEFTSKVASYRNVKIQL